MNKKQEIIRGHLNCTCDEAYKSRKLTDPNCFLCEYESEIELMMGEYHNKMSIEKYQLKLEAAIYENCDKFYISGKVVEEVLKEYHTEQLNFVSVSFLSVGNAKLK